MAGGQASTDSLEDKIEATLNNLEKAVSFLKVENRLKTFKKWKYKDTDPCNKLKLAEAGFIFVGEKNYEDLLKCFLCQKELDGWERTDDPWDEHVKHSPNCLFIQVQKPSMDASIEEQFTLRKELEAMYLNKFFTGIVKSCSEMASYGKGNTRTRRKK